MGEWGGGGGVAGAEVLNYPTREQLRSEVNATCVFL